MYEQYRFKIETALKQGYGRLNVEIQETDDKKKKEQIEALTTKIIEFLDAKKDFRSIKVDGNLYTAFFNDDGPLNAFYKFVLKKQDEKDLSKRLVIGFRSDKIIIYYYNHKLWELSKSRGEQFKVQFDYNHARYCATWKDKYKVLVGEKYGFEQVKENKIKTKDCLLDDDSMIILTRSSGKNKYSDGEYGDVTGGEIGTIRCIKKSFDDNFVQETCVILSEIMDSYINDKIDFFREKVWDKLNIAKEHKTRVEQNSNTDNNLIEKKWQQTLFNHFKYIDGENDDAYTFAYDLEFSQRYPSDEIKKLFGCNEPDLVAIRFENGKAKNLQLIEVKSTEAACKGKSGIEKHIEGMRAYSELEFFMQSRIEDAIALFKAYKKTGLYPRLTDELIDSIDKIDIKNGIERIILLTGCDEINEIEEQKESALDYVNEDIRNKCKKIDPNCQFWYTENKYYDPVIEIKTDIETYIKNKQKKKDKPKPVKRSESKKRKEIVNHPIYGVGEVKKIKDDIATVYFGKEMKTISYSICKKKNWIEME